MNDSRASIRFLNRGSHTQVVIGPGKLAESAYGDLVAHIRAAAAKPLLVVWEASGEDVGYVQAFKMGMALAGLNGPIAIVLGWGDIKEADRFTELVAKNRGAQVRTCEDVPSAKAWLGVD